MKQQCLFKTGGLAEWFIATVLKTVVRESGPGVRLPQPPQQKPDKLSGFFVFHKGPPDSFLESFREGLSRAVWNLVCITRRIGNFQITIFSLPIFSSFLCCCFSQSPPRYLVCMTRQIISFSSSRFSGLVQGLNFQIFISFVERDTFSN